MTRALIALRNRVAGEDGATAVEYGLMVSLIAVAIILSVTALGGALNGVFGAAAAAI
ncbi:MAG: Flp family type IVb pilin [Actinomycetales bacterium]